MFGLDAVLQNALKEDVGWGDITTESCVKPDRVVKGRFIAKGETVFCGVDVLLSVFALLDERIHITVKCWDGAVLEPGAIIALIDGPARAILVGERTALNLMQRLSGIAYQTRKAVMEIRGYSAKICDTRKTTPGLRTLEKYAVRVGGGVNHRMGLSDGVLIKDNHIRAAGGIQAAVKATRDHVPHTLKVEVETETLEDVRQALEAEADIIMFDNMGLDVMKQAVDLVAGRAKTEASGNMGEKCLHEVAKTGVDYISIGALTHSVRAADISLRFDNESI